MSYAEKILCRLREVACGLQNMAIARKRRGRPTDDVDIQIRKVAALIRGVDNTWTHDMLSETDCWITENYGL